MALDYHGWLMRGCIGWERCCCCGCCSFSSTHPQIKITMDNHYNHSVDRWIEQLQKWRRWLLSIYRYIPFHHNPRSSSFSARPIPLSTSPLSLALWMLLSMIFPFVHSIHSYHPLTVVTQRSLSLPKSHLVFAFTLTVGMILIHTYTTYPSHHRPFFWVNDRIEFATLVVIK